MTPETARAAVPRVLFIQYCNPAVFPPLEHSSRILADHGFRVRFLGIAGATAPELTFLPHPAIEVRSIPEVRPGVRQKLHFAAYALWCLWHAVVWRPDWIYVSDIFASPAGLLLQWVTRRRVIYHEHDWPGALRASLFSRVLLSARRRLARSADLRVAPNAERALWLSSEIADGAPVSVVWNCPRIEEISEPRQAFSRPLQLLYQGSINSQRLPKSVLQGMAAAGAPVRLLIVGYETTGSRGYLQELRDLAEELGLSERVDYLGAVPRSELAEIRRRCHLGIALMPLEGTDRNLRAMAGASNKVFDYMADGVCPIVSDLPEWQSALVLPGIAAACDPSDPLDIARLLIWCCEHPEECRRIGEQGRRRLLEEWNYERQFEPVLHLIETACKHDPPQGIDRGTWD